MRLVKQTIDRDGRGTVVLCPEEAEDMWHAYHLISVGDMVCTTTTRKVIREGATGSTTSNKIKLTLSLEVRSLEFDAASCVLHIAGVNVEENQHVKLGQHHTLHLQLNRNFRLQKEAFDSVAMDRLKDACDPARAAEVAAVAMEPGLAHLCLISGHMTITRARIELTIPKKRAGASNHAKAMTRFHEAIYQAVLRHVDFAQIKCVLVGSPGYANQDFVTYLNQQAMVREDRALLQNRSKFVTCRASSGHKRAVAEMIAIPEVAKQLLDTRVVGDVQAMERFFKMLNTDQDRAYYGYNHVHTADEQLAVDTLMVTDTLFKSSDTATRTQYVNLVESVKDHGGTVHIFSSLHPSGTHPGAWPCLTSRLTHPTRLLWFRTTVRFGPSNHPPTHPRIGAAPLPPLPNLLTPSIHTPAVVLQHCRCCGLS